MPHRPSFFQALLGSPSRHRDHLDTVARAREVRDEAYARSQCRPDPAPIDVTLSPDKPTRKDRAA